MKPPRVSTATPVANAHAASHFPTTTCQMGTGLASSGSSEPRSRSPAVESMAMVMPPRSGERMANMVMRNSRNAPFCRGVAVLTCCTFTGSVRSGLTPRAIMRSIPVSRLKARISRSAWRMAGPESVRESS